MRLGVADRLQDNIEAIGQACTIKNRNAIASQKVAWQLPSHSFGAQDIAQMHIKSI